MLCAIGVHAQKLKINTVPEGLQKAYLDGKDTVPVVNLKEIYIYQPVKFKNKREQARYTKLVRDVKRTLPYAKMVYATLIESYENIETLPDEQSRHAHMKRMEKELFQEYKPQLKKLTFSQGKLLIKLIDRECNQSSYNLLKAYLGSFRAGFWNIFASMFGASLVVVLVENGLIWQLLKEIPDDNTGSHRNIQRMLGPILRYFNTHITVINDTLLNTFHLVSHDNCILFILVQQQIIKHRATFGLLNRTDSISLLLQFINSLHRIFKILPIDSFFRSQSRLMNLGMRRTSRDTAQVNTLHPKSIRRTKHGSYIV